MGQSYNVYTGRGGAGNVVASSEKPSPKVVPQGSQTPNLLQPVFSTGRGGAGNMCKNVDYKLTRKAQDVDEDFISPAEDEIQPASPANDLQNATSQSSRGRQAPQSAKSSLKPKRSRHETPQTVSIGRGGAGNILSPSNSKRSESEKKAKKPSSIWGNVKKIFSS
ncbi:LANO_0E13124g1_1 [Lachancea nothofagi CBS 11611]|uniref:LANO_0E13124g1_1 n=1 Tax=Lachancea nothofagi CBS 11611 TaxID=1266666 RepID=A0A1G4JYM1_9SACH|nr:LANO_0E13124g1_1 [Lachancea nothofagi CBS 11611]